MKLAYNPLGLGAYIPAPAYEDDIIFDLVTKVTYVKGVPFYGKKYEYFKKHTSPDNTGGSEGLVPAPSYTTTNTRLLREDGEWVHVPGASPPDSILDTNSTNTVENQAVAKEILKLNALIILKAEHVYKNIVVNGVLIQALGTNDTLEFIQGDGIALTPNPDDKTIIISTKVLGLLGINTYYASGQLVVKVDDLYYNHWNETYNWYRSVTDEDTDVYINKWLEIVDFLNNVLSGTNILDEFVTRKTPQEIIGAKTFTLPITSSVTFGTAPFIITSPTLVTNLNSDLWDGKHLYKPFEDSEGIDSSALLWESNGASTGLTSMQYAMVLNVNAGDAHGRRWQIWNSRNNHQLYWRPELSDMSGYAPEHILLDSLNYKGFIELMYWANIPILSVSDLTTIPTFGGIVNTPYIRSNSTDGYYVGDRKAGAGTTDNGLLLYSYGENPISLYTKGTERIHITANGLVGIGTLSPSHKLHVAGNAMFNGTIYTNTNYNKYDTIYDIHHTSISSLAPDLPSGHNNTIGIGKVSSNNNSGYFSYHHVGDGSASNYIRIGLYGADDILNIVATKNVGIGTTTPNSKLHVHGGCIMLSVNNDWLSPAYLQIGRVHSNVYSTNAAIGVTDGNLHLDAYPNKGIYLNYYLPPGANGQANTALVVLAGGNVGIGIAAPSTKLDVEGDGKIYGNLKVGRYLSGRPTVSTLGNSQLAIGNYYDKGRTTFAYGTAIWTEGSGKGFIQLGRGDGIAETYSLILQLFGGNVGIRTDSPSYPLHVVGDSYTTGWSRAGDGFYVEGKGVHYMSNSLNGYGQIYLTGNEFNWSAGNTTLYFNYRAGAHGKTVNLYIWNAGSPSSYANHTIGNLITRGTIFFNSGDATLKMYSGRITDAKSDGNVCLQTSIDGTDGQSHAYPTLYGSRCNLVLQPRGGLVYIGTNPDGGNTSYKLYVNGLVYGTYFAGNTASTDTLKSHDTRNSTITPSTYGNGFRVHFQQNGTNGVNDGGTYYGLIHIKHYGGTTDHSGGYPHQIAFTPNNNLWHRIGTSSSGWGSWIKILDTNNYTSTLDGRYVNVTGDTMTGNLSFTDNKGITGVMGGGTDNWGVIGTGTGDNGRLKIYVGDNGTTDWIDFEIRDYGGIIYTPLQMTGGTINLNGAVNIIRAGKTLTIGSQNATYCHYSTSASMHWFNKTVEVDGNVTPYGNNEHSSGSSTYRWSNVYSYLGNFAGAITTASTPGSWVSGMTGAAILYRGLSAIDASSFWRFYNMKSSSGHVVCYGGLGNNIGFYGYYAGRTANSYDWYFVANTANGNWTATKSIYAAHFYENSDILLKTNIQSIINSKNTPEIKEFDWIESGEHSYGLIAQELEEQGYSELVSVKDDGYKTVNYSAALSLIVGKLQVKIKELEKEIETLKNKN